MNAFDSPEFLRYLEAEQALHDAEGEFLRVLVKWLSGMSWTERLAEIARFESVARDGVYVAPNIEMAFEYMKEQALAFMPYDEYLRTDHWRQTRKDALERADHKCQTCSATDRLQVHHRTYARRGFEEPTDLTVLCDDCHKTFHTHRKLAR